MKFSVSTPSSPRSSPNVVLARFRTSSSLPSWIGPMVTLPALRLTTSEPLPAEMPPFTVPFTLIRSASMPAKITPFTVPFTVISSEPLKVRIEPLTVPLMRRLSSAPTPASVIVAMPMSPPVTVRPASTSSTVPFTVDVTMPFVPPKTSPSISIVAVPAAM